MLSDRLPRGPWRPGGVIASLALISACASNAPPPVLAPSPPGPIANTTAEAARVPSTPAPAPVAAAAAPDAPPSPAPTLPPAPPIDPGPAVAALLPYAERVQGLSPLELTLEIATLGDPGTDARRQMQLAIALMHSNQPVETAKAMGWLQRLVAGRSPDHDALRPLARLLLGRLQEQRRLDEINERQAQQLREQQRRIEQLNDRLEAMRAIERSLNSRPPTAPRPTP